MDIAMLSGPAVLFLSIGYVVGYEHAKRSYKKLLMDNHTEWMRVVKEVTR